MKRNLFKLFSLTIALQLFYSCAVDDYEKVKHRSDSEIRLEYKPFFELMKEKKFNSAYSKVAAKQQTALQHKTVMEGQYDFTISDKPVTIINTDAGSSYNILIHRDSIHDGYFENLVVQVDTLNQTWAYILKYKSPATLPGELYDMEIFPINYDDTQFNSKYDADCLSVCSLICNVTGPNHPASHAFNGDTCTAADLTISCTNICPGDNVGVGTTSPGGVGDSGSGGGGTGGGTDLPPPPPNNCSKCNPPVIVAPIEPEPEDNCTQLNNVLKPEEPGHPKETPNLKPQIEWLKTKVSMPTEFGVEIKKTVGANGNDIYTPNQVESQNQDNVELTPGAYYLIWLHSHPTEKTYGMFSFGDLRFFRNAYTKTSESRKAEATTIIVCEDPNDPTKINTYALKIDDFAMFNTKVNEIWDNLKYSQITDPVERIELIHYAQALNYKASNGNLEKSFLEQFAGFGISLYKATPNLASWNKLELTNNPNSPLQSIVQQNPCN